MKLSASKILRWIAIVYIEYVRGTPLLVQIFIVYFGTGVLGLDLSKLTAGCIALALNSAAYVAEIIRAGISHQRVFCCLCHWCLRIDLPNRGRPRCQFQTFPTIRDCFLDLFCLDFCSFTITRSCRKENENK